MRWIGQGNWQALVNYLKDGTATLTSNLALLSAWTGNVTYIISAKNSTDNVLLYPAPQNLKHLLDVGTNLYMTPTSTLQYYTIDGGYFRLIDGGTTSSDSIYLRYVKQHSDLSVDAAASTVITDTCTTSGTTVSAFTGVIATHAGGRFVGTDSGGHTFDRLITAYVSSTSFTIDSAVTDDGSTCTGYIVPPSQNDIEIDSQYWDQVLNEAFYIYCGRYPTQSNIARLHLGT
jgi:hypothetical protein